MYYIYIISQLVIKPIKRQLQLFESTSIFFRKIIVQEIKYMNIFGNQTEIFNPLIFLIGTQHMFGSS